MSNIRIRTTPNGGDKFLKVKLEQDFDFIEVLSLKISQEEVYRRFYSDYGVVVGRVIVNNGVGVPNAKVSIFIPLSDDDATNDELKSLYPYVTSRDTNEEGIRYNLLPNDYQNQCHTPVGTFPTKNEILDNDTLFEVYDKYYKFTTTTNKAGDFMLFGVPVGNHVLNVDVDLSDIGIFSQRPYDFMEQGAPAKTFKSPTKFKDGKNLNSLTQLKHQQIGVNVLPFWGGSLANEVGITRMDIDLNYTLRPAAIFVGSIFGDNEKNSVNKNCQPRKDLGRLCETVSSEGMVEMIRQTVDGQIEKFDVDGGRVIDDHGAWAYQIPMNLDYMLTDEFGNLVPSEDTTKGIPTRSRVRFRIGMDATGGEGRLRTRAKYLIPHNPTTATDQDFTFGEDTKDNHFRDLHWNKIYTVRNHITRIQGSCGPKCADNRRMIGIKDVDNCVGTKNPFPFNRLDGDFNPLFLILCIIIGIIVNILALVNAIFSAIACLTIRIPVVKVNIRPFKGLFKCIALACGDQQFAPGCQCNSATPGNADKNADRMQECYKLTLAEALNVYEFDFYNDWVNGTLFAFLLKYKKVRSKEKFCSVDNSEESFIVDTLGRGNLKDEDKAKIYHGIIKKYEDELYYAPYDKDNDYMLYATDLYNLGSVFDCDWQSQPSIHDLLIPTTYQIPPFMIGEEPGTTEMANDGNPSGLLFDLTCVSLKVDSTQINSIKRICEIGVGLDEDRSDEPNGTTANRRIDDNDIENQYIRDMLIYLNDDVPSNVNFPYASGFDGAQYSAYREFLNRPVKQSRGNSFYFYFGTTPNNSAIDKMNNKYFTNCDQILKADFIISGNTIDVTTVNGTNGSVNIDIIGGTGPYSYEWSNGADTEDITNVPAGQYTIIVTDANGSTVRRTFTVNGPQPLRVDAYSGSTSGVGNNDGVIYLNSIVGGDGDYTAVLSGPSGVFTVNNPVLVYQFTSLTAGDYTLTVTDGSGATVSITLSVTNPTPLNPQVEFIRGTCFGSEDARITITMNGGVAPYTVLVTGPNYTGTTFNNSIVEAGYYTVLVTDAVGQTFTQSGDIFYENEVIMQLSATTSNPYRVRILNFSPPTEYIFYNTDRDTPLGSITYNPNPLSSSYNVDGYFDYPSLGSGDKIIAITSTYGCESNEISIP